MSHDTVALEDRPTISFYTSGKNARGVMYAALLGGPILAVIIYAKEGVAMALVTLGTAVAIALAGSFDANNFSSDEPWLTLGPDGVWWRKTRLTVPWSSISGVTFRHTKGKHGVTDVIVNGPDFDRSDAWFGSSGLAIDVSQATVSLEEIAAGFARVAPHIPREFDIPRGWF